MDIFTYDNYKKFLSDSVENMPKKGRGQWTRIANYLGLHNVAVSQIVRGEKDFTPEQGYDLCDYLGLSDIERQFFLLLLNRSRAGHFRLKSHYDEMIVNLRTQAGDLRSRLKQDRKLTDETRSIFYSNWYYSGVRLVCSIPGFQTLDTIADRLDLPIHLVRKVVDFLELHNLVVRKEGLIEMGPQRIHVGADSPFVGRHHLNWRLKAIERMPKMDSRSELYFTGPYALSKDLIPVLRAKLIKVIDECTNLVVASDSETLACLNIDLFEVPSNKS